MNYIDYMSGGGATDSTQYIPGLKQVVRFERKVLQPDAPSLVPQGIYIRDFTYGHNATPIQAKNTNVESNSTSTASTESSTRKLSNLFNNLSNKLSYNNIGVGTANLIHRVFDIVGNKSRT